ncbi:Hypothetical predicted protein [Xyrichtys novacula]|uniref:Uncharacterized protein n=1 Tax=Xyrichtys novacula TaxID=13765 RepID=A0AAV1GY52_XYRNO|nr:Hypothetical predicted protein [Xyrichtys novacula]
MALTEAGEDARGLRAELFSLAQVSTPGLCERKSKRQRQKQNLTNSNMRQRAGHLAAARSLQPQCGNNGHERKREGERNREREVGKDCREREREVQEVAEGVQGSIQPAGPGNAFRV